MGILAQYFRPGTALTPMSGSTWNPIEFSVDDDPYKDIRPYYESPRSLQDWGTLFGASPSHLKAVSANVQKANAMGHRIDPNSLSAIQFQSFADSNFQPEGPDRGDFLSNYGPLIIGAMGAAGGLGLLGGAEAGAGAFTGPDLAALGEESGFSQLGAGQLTGPTFAGNIPDIKGLYEASGGGTAVGGTTGGWGGMTAEALQDSIAGPGLSSAGYGGVLSKLISPATINPLTGLPNEQPPAPVESRTPTPVGTAGPAGASILTKIFNGTATSDDFFNVLGRAAPGLLSAYGSSQMGNTLESIANRARADRAPFLAKANEWLSGGPEAYAAGPGAKALKGTLAGLSARFGNPIGSPTALEIATGAGLRDWRSGVTGMANLGLGGEDTRAQLETNAVAANSGIWGGIGRAAEGVFGTAPKTLSLAELLKLLGSGETKVSLP